jgi:hypothetical protein
VIMYDTRISTIGVLQWRHGQLEFGSCQEDFSPLTIEEVDRWWVAVR